MRAYTFKRLYALLKALFKVGTSKQAIMISVTARNGIKALVYIAKESIHGRRVSLSEIATAVNAPMPYLGKILQVVTKHKLLSSVKGPGGGFFLTDAQMNESVIELLQLIDEPYWIDGCVLGLAACSNEEPCPVHEYIYPLKKELLKFLTTTSLKDLAEKVDAGKTFLQLTKE